MKLTSEKIEEIRSAVNIVDIVSGYVLTLRKRGANYTGLCPFHQDTHPSFSVSPQKQIFKCFACQESGDVFKFIMKIKNVSFIEAVKEVADEAGIILEFRESRSEEYYDENEKLYDINESAAEFYSASLIANPDENPGFTYLKKRRLKKEMINHFRLGYSPTAKKALYKYLTAKSYDPEIAVTLGLLGKDTGGEHYDKLPGRIIFPIFSTNGRVIAFAGRSIDPNVKAAKYINSPESPIYYKSNVLYGLFQAKEHIRSEESVILVEGYMDLISLYQNNIRNVVAVSGTAFTESHARLISRFTKNIYLLFDSDSAGIKGTLRSLDPLIKFGMNIRVITLPEGEDPDSFINNQGEKAFRDRIKNAVDFLEFQFSVYERESPEADPFKVSEMIRRILRPLTVMPDELMRESLIKSVAKKFDLRESTLFREFDKLLELSQKEQVRRKLPESEPQEEVKNRSALPAISKESIIAEKEILTLLLNSAPEVIEFVLDSLDPGEFQIAHHKQIYEKMGEIFREYNEISVPTLLSKFSDNDIIHFITDISIEKYSISERWRELIPEKRNDRSTVLRNVVDAIRKLKLSKLEHSLKKLIAKTKSAVDDEEKADIMMEIAEINKNRAAILSEMADSREE